MTNYERIKNELIHRPRRFLVTGAAGFIGSHLTQQLLALGQQVVGLDNLSTGYWRNVEEARDSVGPEKGKNLSIVIGSVQDYTLCRELCNGVDVVLHQAALGSVPRSMEKPLDSHRANVDGFVTLLEAARKAGVQRVVYASSSSVYGDDDADTKTEDRTGRPLSPYATTKLIDECYAEVFRRCYDFECVGLRYFNVFGPRQDPNGPYAAVIPKWTSNLVIGEPCILYGEGSKSRDFCFVENVVQANLLAAMAPAEAITPGVFNIACGDSTRLDSLYRKIRERVARRIPEAAAAELVHKPPRPGDIAHSLADTARAHMALGYQPTHDVSQGLDVTVDNFIDYLVRPQSLAAE